MRDRWVTVYALFCLFQLPLYVGLGRGDIGYDTAIKVAEKRLSRPLRTPQDLEAAARALDDSQSALDLVGESDSRLARLNLQRAILAWNQLKTVEADGHFRKALEQFEATHGPDAFHTSATNLRYAEFLMLAYRYQDALVRFQVGIKPVEDTLGPGNAFAVRMVFRQVSLLTYLGRNGEAATLARGYLPALLRQAGRFEELYLVQVASSLDMLVHGPPGARVEPAPGGQGWRSALLKAHEEGKRRLAGSAEES